MKRDYNHIVLQTNGEFHAILTSSNQIAANSWCLSNTVNTNSPSRLNPMEKPNHKKVDSYSKLIWIKVGIFYDSELSVVFINGFEISNVLF